MSYLHDRQFLFELDNQIHKTIYVKLVVLDNKDQPIESLEGRATGGSINIDGSSAVRRTCNLTLVASELDINQYYWGLENKFTVEIGIINTVSEKYPKLLWFKQGTYYITGFNTSISTNNYTISITGKDKMCKLNGDLGGNLPASIDFGKEEITDSDGEITIQSIPLKRVITELIHTWAEEPYHNILVNDLEKRAVELLENRTDQTLYLFRNGEGKIVNVTFEDSMPVYIDGVETTVSSLDIIPYDHGLINGVPTEVTLSSDGAETFNILKKTYGETVGYRETDLVYAGDLISSIGETITSILDKICKMLGDFEYFYDLDGRFVFQKKKTYLNSAWNPIVTAEVTQEEYIDPLASLVSYTFEGNRLITAISHNPNLQNIKNDFVVWGKKKKDIAIHARYALDRKPTKYVSYEGKEYTAGNGDGKYDWRELIYQMALDYRKYNHKNEANFLATIAQNNSEHYPTGYTGYEKYYTDLEGFWRQLYDKDPPGDKKSEYRSDGWHIAVENDPASLVFWFDFLDIDSDLGKYSIPKIGDRPKVINESTVTGIYFEEIPTVLFIDPKNSESISNTSNYTVVQMNNVDMILSVSAQGISAKEKIDELLYNHSYCLESITLTTLPIYYLDPNTLIYVYDEKSKIDGTYIVSKITIPLTYNGTMSISATKAPKRFI